MQFVLAKDASGSGSWLLILGCPLAQAHQLLDETRQVSGPSFAACADCPHQTGTQFENRDPELDWSISIHPERLECGYHLLEEEAGEVEAQA